MKCKNKSELGCSKEFEDECYSSLPCSRQDEVNVGKPLLDDGRLIKKIMLRKGIKKNDVTKISNMFEKWGKFLENGTDDNGDYYIIAQ